MPETDRAVKRADAIRILQIVKSFFLNDENDPVMRQENLQYREALDMAIEALKAAGK